MDRPLDGYVYGQEAAKLPTVPDVPGMLEAADIPLGDDSGGLPHSLEWYAGAKDRQKARDAESEELIHVRDALRNEWSDMACSELFGWISKIEAVANEPEPQDINALLARTVAERPYDKIEIDLLRSNVMIAEEERAKLREANSIVLERMRKLDTQVREQQEKENEEERIIKEQKRAAAEKKQRMEEALRKAQLAMFGRDPDEDEGDNDEIDEEAEVEGSGPLPPLSGLLPPQAIDGTIGTPGRGLSLPPTPPSRTGLARELPPLANTPVPPQLE
jgi:hypothetical protein